MIPKEKKYCGVGINDATYAVVPVINGKRVRCPFYERWTCLLKRCFSPAVHKRQPTYIGCMVDPQWLRFSNFKAWMETQDWVDNELDKDLLLPGNKVYGPDTCIFIPAKLNTVLCTGAAKRKVKGLPLGVVPKNWGFGSYVSARGQKPKTRFLGTYATPLEAHAAWQKAKIVMIQEVFSEIENPDPRVVDAVQRIIAKLQSDIDNRVETVSFHT